MSLAEDLATKYMMFAVQATLGADGESLIFHRVQDDDDFVAAINEALERAAQACEQLARAPAHIHTGCHEADASAIREMKSARTTGEKQ